MTDEDDDALEIPTNDDAPAAAVKFLWKPYPAFGTLACLDGDPGVGKSFVAFDLAARMTAGLPMPDGSRYPVPKDGWRVIVANGDDLVEETLVPRFLAAGGVRENISFFGGLSCRSRARLAEFPHDFRALLHRMRKHAPVGLVIVDPVSVLFPKLATNSDHAVREALAPFAQVAALTGACFLFLRHLNKIGGAKSLYRGSGSIGLAAAVRTALFAGFHPDDPSRTILSMTKSNIGPLGQSWGYHLGARNGGHAVVWEGPTNLTADDLCRMKPDRDSPGSQAQAWLRELLASGPVPAARVEAEAEAAGISFTTLRGVKKKLGVESRKVKRDGRQEWEWSMPKEGLGPMEAL